jgi:hypothetical protein
MEVSLAVWMRNHPWWALTTTLIIVAGITIFILYLAKVHPFYKKNGSKVKFKANLSTSRGLNRVDPPDDLRNATEEELTAMGVQSNGTYKVSVEPPSRWVYENDLFYDRFHFEQKLHGYREQDPSAFVATLTNVSGQYYNMYINMNEDFFRKGFANSISEQVTAAQAETNINDMIALHNARDPTKMVLLQGTWDARPSSTGARNNLDTYEFNVQNPITTRMNRNLATANLDAKTLTEQERAGSLRTAVRYVDYTVQLTTTDSTTIRVYISDPDHKMADKAVLINGVPMFYDYVADQLVTTRSANTVSFWNGNLAESKLINNQEGEQNDDPYNTRMVNAFAENLVGIPIVLTSTLDTNTLKTLTNDNQVQFDLANSPSIMFRGILDVPNITAANAGTFLAANPKYQVVTFDMPDISLTAAMSIA